MMDLSVVIPTRDRRAVLERTLDDLARQAKSDFGGQLEVVVVDDGSTDDTPSFLDQARPRLTDSGLELIALPPAPSGHGPATARNRGISRARGERILLLGDDTRPTPGALAEHLRMAERHGEEVGVQGRIDWDPEIELTDVMRFLAPEGPQFYFKHLRDGEAIPWSAVLGSNFSAPRRFFLDEPFDERFRHAAFEDTELAWRWARRGRRAIYAERAVCLHRHPYPRLEPFLAKQRVAGRAARRGVLAHPRMLPKVVLQPTIFGAWVTVRHLLRTLTGQRRREDAWDLRCRRAFLRGLLVGSTP